VSEHGSGRARGLAPRARACLEAVCRRTVPVAFDRAVAPLPDLRARVEARILRLAPDRRRRLERLLLMLGGPFGARALGVPGRFDRLDPVAQDAALERMQHSPIAARRAAFQALRRLILATYYAEPVAWPSIGYPGPLHDREPANPWEGPLRAGPDDGGLILRAPAGAGWREPDGVGRLHRAAGATPGPAGADAALWRPDAGAPRDIVLRADVCIVGSGAGGAVVACRLAEAGLDVLVLEEGAEHRHADFDGNEARLLPALYADEATRTTDDLAITLLQGRCVGGGSTINWLFMLRPQSFVMDEWERLHGIELLGARMLGAALDRIEAETNTRAVPEDAHNRPNRLLRDGAARLGWRTEVGAINTLGCVRSGSCGLGCRYGARQGALDVYLPRARAAGARLLAGVSAQRVIVLERGGPKPLKRVLAERRDPLTGRPLGRVVVDAPLVVLAAGAVGTPVVLQRSGLGGGGVGRFLRLHPTVAVVGDYAEPVHSGSGIPQSIVCTELRDGGDGHGVWIECVPFYPGILAAAVPGFGTAHRGRMRRLPNLALFIALVRDGATPGSAGSVRAGRGGRVSIGYRLRAAERRLIAQGLAAAARIHLAAGALSAWPLHTAVPSLYTPADVAGLAGLPLAPNRVSLFSAHVNGTCRMGTDRSTSGCAPDGQRHGVPGLWVADGSLLPSAPGVNPQATIMALASLVAERILDA
jgi:choline dehydrogenase-like flavoprotein